ncbi:MAG: hypothetical protein PF692_00050 [Kiritimatiellae bacterium]|jgi:hypothetical protein|nr:hypothetical protein [Kiritimatiellia bacterium]
MKSDQIAVSPCSNPEMDIDEVLQAYSAMGYTNFEVFTSWAKSAFNYHLSPKLYLGKL